MTKQQLKELKDIADDLEELTGANRVTVNAQRVIMEQTLDEEPEPQAAIYAYDQIQPLNAVLFDRMGTQQKRLEEIFDRLHVALMGVEV